MKGLSVRRLGVRLGSRMVVRDVSFECGAPQVIGLVGPNGAGKTSLLRAIAGLLRACSGEAVLDGAPVSSMTASERGRLLAYLPQDRTIDWPLAAREVVMLGRLPHRRPMAAPSREDEAIVDRVMEKLDVAALSARPVTHLSGGEKCRVLIARAFAQVPRLLLADEPTSGLDPAHQIEVMELLRSAAGEERIVIVTLHDLSLATRWCDRILVLRDGRLVADDGPDEALSPPNLRQVFGIEAARLRDGGDLVILPRRSIRTDALSAGPDVEDR